MTAARTPDATTACKEKTGNELVCPKRKASFSRTGQSGEPPEVIPNTFVENVDLIKHGKNISYVRILYLYGIRKYVR